jgi:phage tail protein X
MTCSDSVQVGGECWLNGTVNDAAFGVMVRLCKDEFPVEFSLAQQIAEGLIRSYKSLGAHPEDSEPPLKWFRATFFGGPGAKPSKGSGNRSQCKCAGCPLDGSVVNWDYVWEPVKPRTIAKDPVLTLPSPPPAPAPAPSPSAKTHTVIAGDTLSSIARKYYGNSALWTKIYAANRGVIGANPNLVIPGQSLVIP